MLASIATHQIERATLLRHRIHREPELGNREFRTARRIAVELRRAGIEVREGVAHTGVVGTIEGGRPGPTVAIRADIDALPITERTDFPFRSRQTARWQGREVGISHACGHDIHTAVLVGVAGTLAKLRSVLPGTIRLFFQPAEEGPPPDEDGGARMMISEGVLDDRLPEAIFALHIAPELPVGTVAFTPGSAWAAVDEFTAQLTGRPAHGARPELGIDPIVMAAEAVMAMQTIKARSLPAMDPAVLTIGVMQSGERFNIIPEVATLQGTVRTYSEDARRMIEQRMRQVLAGIAAAHGGESRLDYRRVTPLTVNDPALAARMLPALRRAAGEDRVLDYPPSMGGEDFAFFAERIPGFYFRLGSCAPGTESGGLHTPTLRADDSAIASGVRIMSNLVVDFLTGAA
jgi:amidohydrolase